MGRKKPEDPPEVCVYCEQDVPCVWTLKMGAAEYAMCVECSKEATKDFFSYRMRTDEDRKKTKGDDATDSE